MKRRQFTLAASILPLALAVPAYGALKCSCALCSDPEATTGCGADYLGFRTAMLPDKELSAWFLSCIHRATRLGFEYQGLEVYFLTENGRDWLIEGDPLVIKGSCGSLTGRGDMILRAMDCRQNQFNKTHGRLYWDTNEQYAEQRQWWRSQIATVELRFQPLLAQADPLKSMNGQIAVYRGGSVPQGESVYQLILKPKEGRQTAFRVQVPTRKDPLLQLHDHLEEWALARGAAPTDEPTSITEMALRFRGFELYSGTRLIAKWGLTSPAEL